MAEEPGFDFLGDRWKVKAEHEHSESAEFRSPILEEIEAGSFGNPILESLLRDLKDMILRYAISADRLSMAKKDLATGHADIEEVNRADEIRKRVHNVLIDQVNILSNAFLREGLPNKWRYKLGDSREEIGAWAFGAAEYLRVKTKEELQ